MCIRFVQNNIISIRSFLNNKLVLLAREYVMSLEQLIGFSLREPNCLHVPCIIGNIKIKDTRLGSLKNKLGLQMALYREPNNSLKRVGPGGLGQLSPHGPGQPALMGHYP